MADHAGYAFFLGRPTFDNERRAVVGPFPRITDAARAGYVAESPPALADKDGGMLEYSGSKEALLLPSLDAVPLLEKVFQRKFERITIIVGVNSDAYNNGLGVMLRAWEPPPTHGEAEGSDSEEDWYEYGGGGAGMGQSSLTKSDNVVKFHPGMGGGQLRVEGTGGFHNTDVGFTPLNLSDAGERLHVMEITVSADGDNEVRFISATDASATWTGQWKNKLFDGKRLPSVFVWKDLPRGGPVVVGPVSVRAETSESRLKALLQDYAVTMSKCIAGLVRLLLEDVLQGLYQTIYLIKQWHVMTRASIIFTMFSIGTGVVLSVMGPLTEFRAARNMRRKAQDGGALRDLEATSLETLAQSQPAQNQASTTATEPAQPLKPVQSAQASVNDTGAGKVVVELDLECFSDLQQMTALLQQGLWQQNLSQRELARKGPELQVSDAEGQNLPLEELRYMEEDDMDDIPFPLRVRAEYTKKKPKGPAKNVLTLHNVTIVDFLSQKGRGSRHANARRAHAALVFSSLMFWALMAILFLGADYFLNVTCDGDPPATGIFLFFASTVLDLLIQTWVAMQNRQGFLILALDFHKPLLGALLSMLGRFDTFGDVMNTLRLTKCEPITWFSIKGRYFYIPFGIELAHLAAFTLFLGVFLFQALPAIFFLVRKTYLPLALKLNEFNLLLAIISAESQEFEHIHLDDREPLPSYALPSLEPVQKQTAAYQPLLQGDAPDVP